jgi:hypothetical protein
MRRRLARTGLTLFYLAVFAAAACAQQAGKTFFLYLQNEAGAPFYVKNSDSVMSSTPAGYMIIHGLQKGQYRLTIGFPKNQMPEASFDVAVKGSGDEGFLIRKTAGGFDLVSLQDSHVIRPVATASAPGNRIVEEPPVAYAAPKKKARKQPVSPASTHMLAAADTSAPPPAPAAEDTGAFSRMLNQITGGTKAAAVPPAEGSADSGETVAPAAAAAPPMPVADTPLASVGAPPTEVPEQTDSQAEAGRTASPAPAVTAPPPAAGQPQFITFQVDSSAASRPPAAAPDTGNAAAGDSARQVRQEERALHRREQEQQPAEQEADSLDFLSAFIPKSKPAAPPVARQEAADTAQSIPNSDCVKVAGEDDFQKLRRKMASRSSERSMFDVAEKYFGGGECYTTSQIQSLTYLFMTDEYKYKFLELAYPHTADSRNFPSLIATLGDSYYRDRFKAMMK